MGISYSRLAIVQPGTHYLTTSARSTDDTSVSISEKHTLNNSTRGNNALRSLDTGSNGLKDRTKITRRPLPPLPAVLSNMIVMSQGLHSGLMADPSSCHPSHPVGSCLRKFSELLASCQSLICARLHSTCAAQLCFINSPSSIHRHPPRRPPPLSLLTLDSSVGHHGPPHHQSLMILAPTPAFSAHPTAEQWRNPTRPRSRRHP